jgi:ABC-2 type transport system ATP-binding protein
MQTLIETQGLRKQYGTVRAVDGIDLHVAAGSVYGFLGPNGSGKTTTIRMLLGLARPTAGRIALFGASVRPGDPAALGRIGALVETPSYYPHLTGRENLEILRVLRRAAAAAVPRALEFVGLEHDAGRPVKEYSLGMRQRLGLAMALLGAPDLLVLDEPTNGLDPAGIHEIRALLRRLPAEAGITVFVSSHLLSEVELIATHVGILRQGRLAFEGTPAQLRAAYPEQLAVKTDRPAEAGALLARAGWPVAGGSDRTLLVPIAGEADAARITRELVRHGLAVFALQPQRPSLEDMFLSMTNGE